jgi:Cft2 family RNA processing exonuclease
VAGTLGNKLLRGVKNVNINKKSYDVKMTVKNMSFSAHADSKGKQRDFFIFLFLNKIFF